MIYLASPYTHPNPDVRGARFRAACEAAAKLMREGKLVFSPIAHSHSIAEFGDLPSNWDFWANFDRWFIEHCDEVVVLKVAGWEESFGVRAEIRLARALGKRVTYLEPGG